jgi:uncharacterized protein YkwD
MRAAALAPAPAALAVAVAVAVVAAPAQAGCGTAADRAPTARTLAASERAALCLVNQQRTKRDLPALRKSGALTRSAAKHSADMVARRFFDHVNPDGLGQAERAAAEGYSGQVGENIYTGAGAAVTPRLAVRYWMRSPDHRKNLLAKAYRDGGLGIAVGTPLAKRPGATYTNTFGIPAPKAG